jgi:radical SAM protein with 4Fe4S-binding SPASM domain
MRRLARDFILQIHITHKCTYNCKHCYLLDKNSELSLDQFKDIIDQYVIFIDHLEKMFKVTIYKIVHLTGGDPLLHPDLFKMLDYCNSNGIKIGLMGNPDLLTFENVKDLSLHNVISYQISIDNFHGIKKDLYTKALKNLNYFNIKPFIMYNLVYNNKDNLLELMDYFNHCEKQYKPNSFTFARVVKTGNAESFKNNKDFTPEEFKDFLYKAYDKSKIMENSEINFNFKEPLFSLLLYEVGELKIQENNCVYGSCLAGINLFCVSASSDIYACRRLNKIIGNISKDTFEDLFFKNDFIKDIRNYKEYNECNNCALLNYCRGCRAIAYTVNNNIYEKDPMCWKK